MNRTVKNFISFLRKKNQAQVIVEFLVVFPVVLIFILGIFEFALLSLVHQNVNYAAFNAARAEIVGMEPDRSAWMSLIAMSPHYVEGLSPKEALILKSPQKAAGLEGKNSLQNMLKIMTGSDCAGEMAEFLADCEIIKDERNVTQNMIGAINVLISWVVADSSDIDFSRGELTDEEKAPDDSYDMPALIRKSIYANAFSDVSVEEIYDDQAPAVKVTVTYYYPLKFPVIRTLIKFALRTIDDPSDDIFTGKGRTWARAKELSRISSAEFIPVSHWCILGDEKKLGPQIRT